MHAHVAELEDEIFELRRELKDSGVAELKHKLNSYNSEMDKRDSETDHLKELLKKSEDALRQSLEENT